MKKVFLIVLTVALALGTATIIWAGVSGSPHDPRVVPGSSSTIHVCESCHAPHNATTNYPLWNRNRVASASDFTTYSSPTQDMTTDASLLGYQSILCFSCHDGAVSDIVTAPRYDNSADYSLQVGQYANLDTDLTNDHPVGFVFDATLDQGGSGVRNLNVTNSAINISATVQFPLYPVGANTNTFQCATCHSVHDSVTYNNKGVSEVYFLRTSNEGSVMCAQCHPVYY